MSSSAFGSPARRVQGPISSESCTARSASAGLTSPRHARQPFRALTRSAYCFRTGSFDWFSLLLSASASQPNEKSFSSPTNKQRRPKADTADRGVCCNYQLASHQEASVLPSRLTGRSRQPRRPRPGEPTVRRSRSPSRHSRRPRLTEPQVGVGLAQLSASVEHLDPQLDLASQVLESDSGGPRSQALRLGPDHWLTLPTV